MTWFCHPQRDERHEGRTELIIEASTRTALRKGNWIMIPPYQGNAIARHVNIELGNSDVFQLYNLDEDIGEQNNRAVSDPEKLKEMIEAFVRIRGNEAKEVVKLSSDK